MFTRRLERKLDLIMSALSDLQNEFTQLSADASAVLAALQALQAAGNDDAGVEAVVAQMQTLYASLKAAVAPPAPPASGA